MSSIQADVGAMVYNYFYNGWAYRLGDEGHGAVKQDSEKAQERVMKELRESIKTDILEEQANGRREKLRETEEAVIVT